MEYTYSSTNFRNYEKKIWANKEQNLHTFVLRWCSEMNIRQTWSFSLPGTWSKSLVLICHRCTCAIAAGTAWDTVPIRELKWPGTWPYQSLLQAYLRSWLKLNFPGMLAVKLCDGSSLWWHMFSFVREVAQVVPVATSQIHRRQMRTRLKSRQQRRIIANIFGKEVDFYWREVCSTNSVFIISTQ